MCSAYSIANRVECQAKRQVQMGITADLDVVYLRKQDGGPSTLLGFGEFNASVPSSIDRRIGW